MKKSHAVLSLLSVILMAAACTVLLFNARRVENSGAASPEAGKETSAGKLAETSLRPGETVGRQSSKTEDTASEPGGQDEPKVPSKAASDKPKRPFGPLADGENKQQSDFSSMMKEKMKDPATREQMMKMGRMQLDMIYGPILKRLGIEDEKADKLKDLLMERISAQMDIAYGDGDKESRKDMKAKSDSAYEQAAKDLLGEADYREIKSFEEGIPDRQRVNMTNQSLGESERLDSRQQEEFIAALSDQRKQFESTNGKLDADMMDMTAESCEKMMAKLADLHKLYLDCANSYLNSSSTVSGVFLMSFIGESFHKIKNVMTNLL